MNVVLLVLSVLGLAALIGGIAYLARRAEARRAEALQTALQDMGFAADEEVDCASIGDFPLFHHGRRPRLRHPGRGTLGGRPVILAEFCYVVSTGKSSHRVRQTVLISMAQDRNLPDFELSPENVLHRIGQIFGYRDIDFESAEAFSKRYLLRGADEEAIRRVFGVKVLALFESQPGWSVQARGGRLLVFRAGKAADPDQLSAFAAEALQVAAALSPRPQNA